MIQTLEVISVNLWQILISLANLLLIFLILKKFLWKPVKKVMDERKAMVDKQFADAAAAQEQAEADKAQWAAKLATADDEAKARIAAADETARHHGDRLVADAKDKADSILRMAEAEAVLERQKAQAGEPLGILICNGMDDYTESRSTFAEAIGARGMRLHKLPMNPFSLRGLERRPQLHTHTAMTFADALAREQAMAHVKPENIGSYALSRYLGGTTLTLTATTKTTTKTAH